MKKSRLAWWCANMIESENEDYYCFLSADIRLSNDRKWHLYIVFVYLDKHTDVSIVRNDIPPSRLDDCVRLYDSIALGEISAQDVATAIADIRFKVGEMK